MPAFCGTGDDMHGEGGDRRLRVLAPPLSVAGFAIHMAWHNRTHRDAAQRLVSERLVKFVQALA